MNTAKVKEFLIDLANGRWVTVAQMQKHVELKGLNLKELLKRMQTSTSARVDLEYDQQGNICAVIAHRIIPSNQSNAINAARRRKVLGILFAPESFAFRGMMS